MPGSLQLVFDEGDGLRRLLRGIVHADPRVLLGERRRDVRELAAGGLPYTRHLALLEGGLVERGVELVDAEEVPEVERDEEVEADEELEALVDEVVDVDEAGALVVLEVIEVLVVLEAVEGERSRTAPSTISTMMTTTPITAGVDTPRLVRMG